MERMSTDTSSNTVISPDIRDGDHERFAHYVKKPDILRATVEGVEIEALCGKRWIPDRDPRRYPVCPTCREILARLRSR